MSDPKKQDAARSLKSKIDSLRKKLDRYENTGAHSVEANYCVRQISVLQKELKELTGEEY